MDEKIIEDPNLRKEPDTTDLTNINDGKESDSGKQDEPNWCINTTFHVRKTRKIMKNFQHFKPMKWSYKRQKKVFLLGILLPLVT